jgi:hypothetical protein
MATMEKTPASQTGAGEQTRPTAPSFDPGRLAYLEVAGWRAYVDKKWGEMLWLLLNLAREQFGFSWPRAVQGAYYVVRASILWKPVDHDVRAVRRYLRKFYKLAVEHGKGFHFDSRRVADLELKYWVVSRQYSSTPYRDDSPLIPVLAELHSAIFGIPIEEAQASAIGRARSLHAYGQIAGGLSTDIEGDWQRSEEYLREGYRTLVLKDN